MKIAALIVWGGVVISVGIVAEGMIDAHRFIKYRALPSVKSELSRAYARVRTFAREMVDSTWL